MTYPIRKILDDIDNLYEYAERRCISYLKKSIKRKNVKHGGKLSANNIAAVQHPLDLIGLKSNTNTRDGNNISTNVGVPPNGNPVNGVAAGLFIVIFSTIGYLVLK